eukprot:639951-Alexandrium_andersonii.AAC.1
MVACASASSEYQLVFRTTISLQSRHWPTGRRFPCLPEHRSHSQARLPAAACLASGRSQLPPPQPIL